MVRSYSLILLGGWCAFWMSMAGCKKIDIGTTTIRTVKLQLAPPTDISLAGPALRCQADANLSSEYFTYGFCYDTIRMPVIPGRAEAASNFAAGTFSLVVPNIPYGHQYYVRAFVTNGTATTYSNQDSFYLPAYLTTGPITRISPTSFTAAFSRLPAAAPFDQWGICYSTKSAPGLTQGVRFAAGTNALTDQVEVVDTLKPATIYYVRSVIVKQGVPYFGKEVTFTTAGYRGGSGGYVLYDKGDSTNGWRYLEASLDTVRARRATWGCDGTLIPGITTGLGTGLGNSEAMVANCAQTNTAAAISRSLRRSTKTDWYLPDSAELRLYQYLRKAKIITKKYRLFTSTQSGAAQCVILDSTGTFINVSKQDSSAYILPFRRY